MGALKTVAVAVLAAVMFAGCAANDFSQLDLVSTKDISEQQRQTPAAASAA